MANLAKVVKVENKGLCKRIACSDFRPKNLTVHHIFSSCSSHIFIYIKNHLNLLKMLVIVYFSVT